MNASSGSALKPMLQPILITSGEPAGIGPELCSQLPPSLPETLGRSLVILGSSELLHARAKNHAPFRWHTIQSLAEIKPASIKPQWYLLDVPLNSPSTAGVPTVANATYVLNMLNTACDACLQNVAAAMVTAPVSKAHIAPMWPGFAGHTEYLAQRCGQSRVVMMLSGGNLNVALATTHLPLQDVPKAMTPESLSQTLDIILHAFKTHMGTAKPKVLVCGLNPHAGEQGLLGQEEQTVITPVIQQFQAAGHDVTGPYPADTVFQPKHLTGADVVLAMYHDQGLPVLKYASFGQGVNITLGLPIVRTSVDHGTGFDIAGQGLAHAGSLLAAVYAAHQLALHQKPNLSLAALHAMP